MMIGCTRKYREKNDKKMTTGNTCLILTLKKRRNEVWMEWWILLGLMIKYSVLRWIDADAVMDV
jgi:hypothetical protein